MTERMLGQQKPGGEFERWYGDGKRRSYPGIELKSGIDIELSANEPMYLEVLDNGN